MQKISIYLLAATLLLGLQTRSVAQSNLVVNGDFETQYSNKVPSQRYNILNETSHLPVDELPSWRSVGTQSQADFLATNSGNTSVNPQGQPPGTYGGFTPHSGGGCAGLQREPYSYSFDQFITQQVPVIIGHTYRASFYALWRSTGNNAQKLSLGVTSSKPVYTYSNAISPTPYANIISAPIGNGNGNNWTQVTGTFVAQSSTAYVVVGYDHSQGAYAGHSTQGEDYYAIDDVSVVEISPCDVVLNNYRPINFCSNQTNRPFGVRVPPAGFTFYWEFFRLNPNTGVFAPFYPRGLSRPYTATSANPVLRVQGSQFPAGFTYNYRVRGQNDATGCYTEWSDFSEDSGTAFTMEDSCPSNPGDDDPGVINEDPKPTPPYMDSATGSPTAYPNPASDAITVPINVSEATLSNSQGNSVQRLDGTKKLDVHSLPDGLYNLQMRHEGKLINQRIQVVH